MRIASTGEEARAAAPALATVSPGIPFVRRYVEGPTVLVGGLFAEGRCRQWFAADKLATFPAPAGPSVRCRSTHAPAAVEAAIEIFRTLEFHGLGFAEFIHDARGEPVFIEINPRPWGSLLAARTAGLDFARLAAEQILDRPPRGARSFPAGREAVLFPQYLHACLRRRTWAWRDVRPVLRSPRAAPWHDPVTVARFAREPYWTSDRVRAAGASRVNGSGSSWGRGSAARTRP